MELVLPKVMAIVKILSLALRPLVSWHGKGALMRVLSSTRATFTHPSPKQSLLHIGGNSDNNITEEDTVFALSSGGGGEGGMATAVVRVTGPRCVKALDLLMNSVSATPMKRQSLPKHRRVRPILYTRSVV